MWNASQTIKRNPSFILLLISSHPHLFTSVEYLVVLPFYCVTQVEIVGLASNSNNKFWNLSAIPFDRTVVTVSVLPTNFLLDCGQGFVMATPIPWPFWNNFGVWSILWSAPVLPAAKQSATRHCHPCASWLQQSSPVCKPPLFTSYNSTGHHGQTVEIYSPRKKALCPHVRFQTSEIHSLQLHVKIATNCGLVKEEKPQRLGQSITCKIWHGILFVFVCLWRWSWCLTRLNLCFVVLPLQEQ